VGVHPAKTVQRETHETGEGDVPPPHRRAPSPRGDIPSMHYRGRASPRLDVNTLPKSCLVPVHSIRCYRHSLPAPFQGAGGGGGPAKTVQRLRQETGEGDVPPPHRRAPPHGAIPHGYSLRGSGSLFAVSPDTPPKVPAPAQGTVSGAIANQLPAPMEKTSLVKHGRWGGHQPALRPSIPHTSCPRTHPIIRQAGDPGLTAG